MARFSAPNDDETTSSTALDRITDARRRQDLGQRHDAYIQNGICDNNMQNAEHVNALRGHQQRHLSSFGRDNWHLQEQSCSHPYWNDFDHGTEPISGRKVSYGRHLLLVMFLFALQHYAPPPVPPFDSWAEFISQSTESFRSTATKLLLLAYYVGTGCFHNMKEDGMAKIDKLQSRVSMFLQGINDKGIDIYSPCPMSLPITESGLSFGDVEEMVNGVLREGITGQNRAMDSISRALATWNLVHISGGDEIDTHSDNKVGKQHAMNRPLNMIFTGPDGVGKYETAKQVANLLLNGCQNEIFSQHLKYCERNLSCTDDNSDRILDVQGIDFALEKDSDDRDRSEIDITRHILNHIYRQNDSGAVIIIRHVEHLPLDSKLELFRLLSKPNVSFNIETSSTWGVGLGKYFYDYDNSSAYDTKKTVNVQLDNCVFLLTTDLGTDKIFQGLRKYGLKAENLYKKVQSAIQKDVEAQFGSELFDVIAPFWPLQYANIEDILKRQFNKKPSVRQHRIEIRQLALKHLSGPNFVDYIEMIVGANNGDKGDTREAFVFAKRGGHDLVHDSVIKAVNKKLHSDTFHDEDEFALLDYNERQIQLLLCRGNDRETCFERGVLGV